MPTLSRRGRDFVGTSPPYREENVVAEFISALRAGTSPAPTDLSRPAPTETDRNAIMSMRMVMEAHKDSLDT